MDPVFDRIVALLDNDGAHERLPGVSEYLGRETVVEGFNKNNKHTHCFGYAGVGLFCLDDRFLSVMFRLAQSHLPDADQIITGGLLQYKRDLPAGILSTDNQIVVQEKLGLRPVKSQRLPGGEVSELYEANLLCLFIIFGGSDKSSQMESLVVWNKNSKHGP